jgi:thiol-disulfide isomerase/thioredoxin
VQPIVDGLQDEYEDDALFLAYDARDEDEGQPYFDTLGLRGHPALLLYDAEGEEVWRMVGVVEESELRARLEGVLE